MKFKEHEYKEGIKRAKGACFTERCVGTDNEKIEKEFECAQT